MRSAGMRGMSKVIMFIQECQLLVTNVSDDGESTDFDRGRC